LCRLMSYVSTVIEILRQKNGLQPSRAEFGKTEAVSVSTGRFESGGRVLVSDPRGNAPALSEGLSA
jgi:hypothetical protein